MVCSFCYIAARVAHAAQQHVSVFRSMPCFLSNSHAQNAAGCTYFSVILTIMFFVCLDVGIVQVAWTKQAVVRVSVLVFLRSLIFSERACLCYFGLPAFGMLVSFTRLVAVLTYTFLFFAICGFMLGPCGGGFECRTLPVIDVFTCYQI